MQLRRLDQLIKDPYALKRTKLRNSFFEFVVEFWGEVVNDPPIFNWHIPFLCRELTDMVERVAFRMPRKHDLVINIPPGCTKSLLSTVFFPAWCWAKWPWFRFIKTSYSSTLAMEHAEKCRDLVKSARYQEIFPYIRINRDKEKKTNFKISFYDTGKEPAIWRLGGNLFSTSVEGTLTGFHGHFLLTDDPIDPFRAYSKQQLESVNRWLSQVLPTRKVEKSIAPHVMIMQRVDIDDPSAAMLDLRKSGYNVKHVNLPATINDPEDKAIVSPKRLIELYDSQGGYLDPVRLGDNSLNDLELILGQYGYAAQVRQNPMVAEKGMFNVDALIENIINPDKYNIKSKRVRSVRYWDKAGTEAGGAFTCGVLMTKLSNNKYVIEDIVRGQWSAAKREKVIDETAERDGRTVEIYIEQEPGSGGKESVESTVSRLKRNGFNAGKDRPVGDKIYRADPYSVVVNNGNVLMVKAPWNKPYTDEVKRFPGGKKVKKDQVDSSSGAYAKLSFYKRAGVWGKKKRK